MSKMTVVLATVAVAGLASLMPVTASASTSAGGATHSHTHATAKTKKAVKPAAAPPACVSATYKNPAGPYQDVYVTNSCPTTQRVKVIWAYATDSACHAVASGATWKDHHFNENVIDRWDGIKAC